MEINAEIHTAFWGKEPSKNIIYIQNKIFKEVNIRDFMFSQQ
jgi:hypothetical protein